MATIVFLKKNAQKRAKRKKKREAQKTLKTNNTLKQRINACLKSRVAAWGRGGLASAKKSAKRKKNKAQNQLKTTMFRPKSRVRARGTSPPQKTLKNRKKPPKWGLFELRIHIKRKITSRLRELRRFLS